MNCFNSIFFNQKFQCNRFHNKIWYLTKRHWKTFREDSINNRKENPINWGNIESSWLSLAGSISKRTEEIIPKIVSKLEANPSFFRSVEEIVVDLKSIYPKADVVVYGSAASNLALAGSDVDLFMDLKLGSNISGHDVVRSVKKKLLRSKLFHSAVAIHARVPIVKCVHRNKISCDISFSAGISIYDSQLIKFLLSIDDRLHPLMLILKFLFKRENIYMINNHTLVVMIIFFLQVLDNPIIPPISYLQSKVQKRTIFDGWDVSFSNDISEWQGIKNNSSVIELLHEFFQFYSTFEFGLNVISVFTANSYLKSVFADANLLPPEYDLYKRRVSESESLRFNCDKCMCIQGVFNHSANISRNFLPHHVRGIQKYCRTFAKIGDELLHKNSSDADKLEFLIKLFDREAQTGRTGKINAGNLDPSDSGTVLTMTTVCLDDANLSADELRNKWWNSVFDKIVEVLRDIVKSEISIQPGRVESTSDKVVEEKIVSCEMLYRELVFKIRSNVERELNIPEGMPRMEKEKMITNHLLQRLEKSETPYKFDVVCVLEKNPTCVRLKIVPKFVGKRPEETLFQICAALRKRIPKWLALYE